MSEQRRAHARGCHLGTGDSRHTDKTLDRCLESGHSLVTPAKVTGPHNRGQETTRGYLPFKQQSIFAVAKIWRHES